MVHAAFLVDVRLDTDRRTVNEALRTAPCNRPTGQAGPEHDKLEVNGPGDGLRLGWHNSPNNLRRTADSAVRRVLSGIAPTHL